jgi:hypothetical protein
MKKIIVTLGQLVREDKSVIVEVPDNFDLKDESKVNDLMHEVFEEDDGEGFNSDSDWGVEEGTHYFREDDPSDPISCSTDYKFSRGNLKKM